MQDHVGRNRCRRFAPGSVFERKGMKEEVEPGKMDSSQYRYLKYNKYLLCCVGQWPYQTPLEKILIGSVFLPIAAFQLIFQVLRSYETGIECLNIHNGRDIILTRYNTVDRNDSREIV